MVKTINIQKCSFQKKYMNIYGQMFHLCLMKQGNTMDITLQKYSNIRYHLIIYMLITIMGIVSFQFNILGTLSLTSVVVVIAVLIYVKLDDSVTEETLKVIEPLGYQIDRKYFMGQSTTFIPYEQVKNIFINEVIFKQKIIFLLTILTNGSNGEQLIPLFLGFKPRIDCLEYIFRELHKED